MKAPPRLRDDPSVASELRKDLERSAQAEPNYDAAAGLAAFSVAIAAGASSAAGTAAAAHAAATQAGAATTSVSKAAGVLGSLSVKGAVAALGTAAMVAVAVANLPAQPSTAPASKATATKSVHSVRVRASSAETARPVETAAPAQAAVEEHAVVPMPVPSVSAPSAEARAAVATAVAPRAVGANLDASARREIAQLGRIKALLESDPRAALRLAEAGHREFARGLLREEREGLAILALWQLGRAHEAEPRARAFLKRYPRSALSEQLAARLRGTE